MKQYAVHWRSKKHQKYCKHQIRRAGRAMRFIGVFLAEKWAAEDKYRKDQTLIREVLWWVLAYFQDKAMRAGSTASLQPLAATPA